MDSGLLVPTVLFLAVAATLITLILSGARTRRMLVERGFMDGRYSEVLSAEARIRTFSALKWGLVLAGFAVGLVIADLANLLGDEPQASGFGIVILGAASGFLAYWRLMRNERFDAVPNQATPTAPTPPAAPPATEIAADA